MASSSAWIQSYPAGKRDTRPRLQFGETTEVIGQIVLQSKPVLTAWGLAVIRSKLERLDP
jgi:hypothetical protein